MSKSKIKPSLQGYKKVLKIFKIKNRWLVTNVSEEDFCAVIFPNGSNFPKNNVELK